MEKGIKTHRDLLSRFMNATNEHGEPLNNKELRDIVLNFVIAGRDTTAQALSWTFYNLLLHPRVEKKLLEEIQLNITDDLMDNPVALYDAIKKMNYAHAVYVSFGFKITVTHLFDLGFMKYSAFILPCLIIKNTPSMMISGLMEPKSRKVTMSSGVHGHRVVQKRSGVQTQRPLSQNDGLHKQANFAESHRVNGLPFMLALVSVWVKTWQHSKHWWLLCLSSNGTSSHSLLVKILPIKYH